jgi:hypothetical protein
MLFLVLAAAISLPPIPPLPAASWPAAADAEPFARALMAQVPAAELAKTLHQQPDLIPPVLRNVGTALMSENERLVRYVGEVARAMPADDLPRLAAIIMIDPIRYHEDAAFRARMNAVIPRTLAALAGDEKRRLLDADTPLRDADFEAIAPAKSIAFNDSLRMPDDSSPISASIFSLNSEFFSNEEAQRFLSAVHKSSPNRKLIVLTDMHLTGVTTIDSYSRPFTPWTRDPFIVARDGKGGIVFVNRPNAQPKRAEDQNMVRAIVQQWDHPRWTVAPIPFHNGNILLTPKAVWISIHTLEPRVLALLGLDHVPTETFTDAAGVARYLSVVEGAARELEKFYRRPVRFVHPMAASPELMRHLSGGAGIDLDSVLTILPNGHALVGDLHLGTQLAQSADWSVARRAYKFKTDPSVQRMTLQPFLDEIATELQRDGMTVSRLPLLTIPASLVDQPGVPEGFEFLITWNNVVLDGHRAEGFASLIGAGDEIARKAFADAGYKLTLFSPLIRSIVLGGGYRCASNHVRRPSS